MDKTKALEEYKEALSEMNLEKETLLIALNNMKNKENPQKSEIGKKLGSDIENSNKIIYELHDNIIKTREENRKLAVEKDWLQWKLPKKPNEIKVLEERLNKLKDENKQLIEIKEGLYKGKSKESLKNIRNEDPNLYFVIKRSIQAEEQKKQLNQMLGELIDERNKTIFEYSEITKKLNVEEQQREKLKNADLFILECEGRIRDLKEKLEGRHKMLLDVEAHIVASGRDETVEMYHKTYEEAKNWEDKEESLRKEIDETICSIETERIQGVKLNPPEFNQKLRQEMKLIESEIAEKSKELKEKEKILLQIQVKYSQLLRMTPQEKLLRSRSANHLQQQQPKLEQNFEDDTKKRKFINKKSPTIRVDKRRKKIIDQLTKSLVEGQTVEALNTLKNYGKPNQGIASKIIELNRGEFLSKMKTT